MPNNDEILKGAKKALARADSFTKSVEGTTQSRFAPKPAPAAAAPAKASPASGLAQEAESAAQGLKARGDQVKTLGSFKKGGIVPKTGNYKLHKDEKVIPAEKAKQMDTKMMDAASSALGKSAPSKPTMKAKLRMRISPTDNKGYIVDHDGSDDKAPEQHSYSDVKSLLKHVGDHYGAQASDWEQERTDAPASPKVKEVAAAGAKKD